MAEEEAAVRQVAVGRQGVMVRALLAESADAAHRGAVPDCVKELLVRRGHAVVDGHCEAAAEDRQGADDVFVSQSAALDLGDAGLEDLELRGLTPLILLRVRARARSKCAIGFFV